MLAPVLDPFDRMALEQLCCRHHGDVFRIDAELGAEAAADVGRRRRASLSSAKSINALIDWERSCDFCVEAHTVDAVVACAEFRQDAAAFDRMAAAAMLPQLLAEHVRRVAERGVGIAVADPVGGRPGSRTARAVPAARPGRSPSGNRRRPAGSRSRPRPVRRRPRRRSGLGEHQRDRLAHVGDLAVGEREGPVVVERSARVRAAQHAAREQHGGEVVESEHRMHAGQRQRGVLGNAADQRVRVGAAHETGVQRAIHRNVADEAAAAAQQRLVLEARDARSDQRRHPGAIIATWPGRPCPARPSASHRARPACRRSPWR